MFVIVSLAEAESIRAAIHWHNSQQQGSGALGTDTALALRVLPAGLVCDSTHNFDTGLVAPCQCF